MWIDDGEKYALVSLEVKLEGTVPPQQIESDLWVLTDTTFDVPSQLREWLGSIRTDEVAGSNLFLVSKLSSATPGVLDGENQALLRRVYHFYVGLLLSAMFSPSHEPVMLTGARQDGAIDIRQQKNLGLPAPQVFRRYPARPPARRAAAGAGLLADLAGPQRAPAAGGTRDPRRPGDLRRASRPHRRRTRTAARRGVQDGAVLAGLPHPVPVPRKGPLAGPVAAREEIAPRWETLYDRLKRDWEPWARSAKVGLRQDPSPSNWACIAARPGGGARCARRRCCDCVRFPCSETTRQRGTNRGCDRPDIASERRKHALGEC